MSTTTIMGNRRRVFGAGWRALAFLLTLSVIMAITTSTSFAQLRQLTLGAMRNVPQLNTINPAITPDSMKWYLGVPMLSGISAHYRNSSFTPAQLGLGQGSGPQFSQALEFADTMNTAYGEVYLEDFAFGINIKDNFLSLTIAERLFANTDYPIQLVEWLGLEQDGADIPLGRTFNLADWNFSAVHYREVALGFGRRLFDGKLTLGGRAKLLIGQASLQSDNYNFRLWHRPEDDYNYEISGRMDILASGFDRFQEGGAPFQLFGGSNTGFAMDLGARLELGPVSLFASVTDLGRLNWMKGNTFTSLRDIAVDGEELFDRATDNLAYDRERGATDFSTELVTKVYAGAQVEIGQTHAISILANPRFHLGDSDFSGSVAYRLRTSRFLDLIASYNVFQTRPNAIGFGATINLRPVQIYFATDKVQSILDRNAQRDFQFAAGINLIIGQPKEQDKVYATDTKPKKRDRNKDKFASDGLFGIGLKETVKAEENIEPLPVEEKEQGVEDKYFTFYGTVIDDESEEPLDAVYVDVYVIGPDDRRELIHTSRYPGHTFNVPLFQNELQHEISVGGHGYARQTLSFRANVARLEHEFRMSDGLWTTEEPAAEPYPESGNARWVSDQSRKAVPPVELSTPAVDPEPEFATTESEVSVENLSATDIAGTFEIIQRTSLRSEPDAQARVMKRLAVGTNLVLLEKTDKYWWKMKLGNQIGYVKQRLLVSVQ